MNSNLQKEKTEHFNQNSAHILLKQKKRKKRLEDGKLDDKIVLIFYTTKTHTKRSKRERIPFKCI